MRVLKILLKQQLKGFLNQIDLGILKLKIKPTNPFLVFTVFKEKNHYEIF